MLPKEIIFLNNIDMELYKNIKEISKKQHQIMKQKVHDSDFVTRVSFQCFEKPDIYLIMSHFGISHL